jgi:hypothetical protein
MRAFSLCATVSFVLGVLFVLGTLYVWPLLQQGLQSGSSSRYNAGYTGNGAYRGYGGNGGYGGYGRDGGDGGYDNGGDGGNDGNSGYGAYRGYGGGMPYRTWGQPTYAVYAPYPRPRTRIAPPPCYSPCDY